MRAVNPQRRVDTRRRARNRGVLLALGLFAAGCYGHQATHTPFAVTPTGLPEARTGRYVLTRGGAEIGEEAFTITSTGAWQAWGETRVGAARRRFRVRIDPEARQPVAASTTLTVEGRTLAREGRVRRGALEVRGGPTLQKVPYAAGTQIDVGSPAAGAWVFGLLSSRLHPGAEVWVRTIAIDPTRRAQVSLRGYFVRGVQDGLRLVEVQDAAGARLEALWLAPDGFVVRARTASAGGIVERRWDGGASASAAPRGQPSGAGAGAP